MGILGVLFRSPRAYRWGLRAARLLQRSRAKEGWIRTLPGYGKGWFLGRDLPALPKKSFREWWVGEDPSSPRSPGPKGGTG